MQRLVLIMCVSISDMSRLVLIYHVTYFIAKFIAIVLNPSFGKSFPRPFINGSKQCLKKTRKQHIEYSKVENFEATFLLKRIQSLIAKDPEDNNES